MTGFGPEDLLRRDDVGAALRAQLAEALNMGRADLNLCLHLAERCRDNGTPALGLWFLVVALPQAEFRDDRWPSLFGPLLAGTLSRLGGEGGHEDERSTAAFAFATLDTSQTLVHQRLSYAVAESIANQPPAGLGLERLAGDRRVAGSESFLTAQLAARLFERDLDGAAEISETLNQRPEKSLWAWRTLAKLAVAKGRLEDGISLLRQAISAHGDNHFADGELATLLYCLGRKDEARTYLRRSLSLMRPEVVAQRQKAMRGFNDTLQKAISEKLTDGGPKGGIGAAANYLDPGETGALWHQHRQACRAENTFRTISGYTNTVMFERVEALLAQNPEIQKVVNYGTLCGEREAELAEHYPDRTFAGYDISPDATHLNQETYQRGNLLFGSDLNRLLEQLSTVSGETLVVHCRTTDVMFPEAVRNVYRACWSHGVGYVLAAEYFSYSFLTLDYPDFATENLDTVQMGGIVVMHNYDKIFPETGYAVVANEYTPMPLLVSGTGEGTFGDQMIQFVLAQRDSRL